MTWYVVRIAGGRRKVLVTGLKRDEAMHRAERLRMLMSGLSDALYEAVRG